MQRRRYKYFSVGDKSVGSGHFKHSIGKDKLVQLVNGIEFPVFGAVGYLITGHEWHRVLDGESSNMVRLTHRKYLENIT